MNEADDCPFDGTVPTAQRQQCAPAPSPNSESALDRIINTPYDSLSFKDYAKLKSGRDRFSAMKQFELQTSVSEMEWRFVVAAFPTDDRAQTSCFRWILRGLDCDRAIRKVMTDLEIAENAISKWKR